MTKSPKGLRIVALALCVAAVLGFAAPSFASVTIAAYGTVLADNTPVYSGTDMTTQIGVFNKNANVGIVASSGTVYQVVTTPGGSDNVGYVLRTAVAGPYAYTALTALTAMTATSTSTAGTTGTTTTSSSSTGTIYNVSTYANMRAKASASGTLVAKVNKGSTVTILGTSGSFYKVSYSGKTGYIDKRYVRVASTGSSDTTTPGTTGSTTYTPTGTDTGAITLGSGKILVTPYTNENSATVAGLLSSARAANSETIGYIYIPGIVTQPILFHKASVHFYATHGLNKKTSSSGSIYAFYGDMVRNNTVTGHNMRQSGTMFSPLHYLQEKAEGYAKSQSTDKGAKVVDLAGYPSITTNNIWQVSLFGYTKWQVFAMYETKANEPTGTLKYNISPLSSSTPSQIRDWVAYQKNRSEIKFNVPVNTDDIFLTVYTCGNNYDNANAQSRLYFFLKAVG